MTLKRTALFSAHQRAGGKLIEFGGWEMPVQYSGIVDEHLVVRHAAGLFDISHMGEVQVRGVNALKFLNWLLTNDLQKLEVGQGQYSIMCREDGGTVDDLYIYRIGELEYFLIINASRTATDVAWMQSQLAKSTDRSGVELRDMSEAYGAVALQGPKSAAFIDQCFPGPSIGGTSVSAPNALKKNQVSTFTGAETGTVLIARTGYTGEDGFEIISRTEFIEKVWELILKKGHAHCCQPAGLGARDTLRTEMGFPLYGHELDEQTSPIEAGLGFFVAFEKGDFCGRTVLLKQKKEGVRKKCVAFKMEERAAPPRPGYPVWSAADTGGSVGSVVSGTVSPSLGVGIGMAYVEPTVATPGNKIEIEVRGRKWPATIVKKPLYVPAQSAPRQ